MKRRQIDQDKYILEYHNDYYVVNEFTFNLMEMFLDKKPISEIAKELNISKFTVNRKLRTLKREIANIEYYDDNVLLDFPLKVQWKITNKCNLKCKHCYLGKLDFFELNKKDLLTIRDKIINSNTFEVTITGGEALVVKSLPEIVASLIENDIKVNIFTNALLLDTFNKNIEKILGYTPTDKLDFFVSIDGLKATHDLIRGKGSFEKTIKNVKLMVKKGYRITTNSVLSRLNSKDIPKLYLYLYKLGVYKIQISNIIDSGNATSDMKLTPNEINDFHDKLTKIVAKLDNGAHLLYAKMPDEQESSSVYVLNKDGKKYLQQENWKCSAGIGKCTIDYNGEVYCCPFIKNYPLGNLVDKSFSDIWKSKNRYEFLKLIAKENNNSRVCLAVKKRMNRDE